MYLVHLRNKTQSTNNIYLIITGRACMSSLLKEARKLFDMGFHLSYWEKNSATIYYSTSNVEISPMKFDEITWDYIIAKFLHANN